MANIPTPDVVALVRRRYREGATVKAVVAESGIRNLNIIYRCLEGEFPDDGSGARREPIPKRRPGVRIRHRAGSRAGLIARMWRTAERQVEEIEQRLDTAGIPLAERESNARTIAIVARTLRELSAVDEAKASRGKAAAKDNDESGIPRNLDDLRRALAQKLEAFVEGTADPVPDEPE